MSDGVGGPSFDDPVDDPTRLAAIGDQVVKALTEQGVSASKASEAAQAYVNKLSELYTNAKNFGFSGGRNVEVTFEPPKGDDVRSVVIRHSNDRFGEVWIENPPLTIKYESVDARNVPVFGFLLI